MVPKLCLTAGIFLAVGAVAAENAPLPDGAKPKLLTKTYDLTPLLGDKSPTTGVADPDAVIRLILKSVKLGELKHDLDAPQIVEKDGGKLEIRATEKAHGEIKDLLDALIRRADLAVDIKAELVEFDPATFDKDVKPLFKPVKGKTDLPAAVSLAPSDEDVEASNKAADALIKKGKLIQTSSRRYANGKRAVISLRRTAVSYANSPQLRPLGAPVENPLHVTEGYRLTGVPVVSADRRFVRLKLAEQSTDVTGIKTREIPQGLGGIPPVIATSPIIADLGRTGSVEVPDGAAILFRLDYAPKDRVWVVIVRPTIFIQAEEDFNNAEKQKQQMK